MCYRSFTLVSALSLSVITDELYYVIVSEVTPLFYLSISYVNIHTILYAGQPFSFISYILFSLIARALYSLITLCVILRVVC